jgi:tol-pal system beta propeller repeat protein TolB
LLGIRWRGCGLALAGLLTLLVLVPSAHAAFPGQNGKIAFTSNRDGNYEIYAMGGDGSGPTRLTNTPQREGSPAWSPDGRRIAFASERDGNWEIYVMNADGSGQTRVTIDPGIDVAPAWSPDGTRLAFMSNRTSGTGINQIWVMESNGAGQTRLTDLTQGASSPSWSPDGRKIAFYGVMFDTPIIFVMNADGSGMTNLPTAGDDYGPDWSPDGTKITFPRGVGWS